MPRVIINTSVVIKWFIEGEDTSLALTLQERFFEKSINLIITELLLYELANALCFTNLFSKEEIKMSLQALLLTDIEVSPFNYSVLERAVDLSLERNLAIYDAYFLACAEKFKLVYVTADRRAYSKLKNLEFVSFLGNIA